MKEKLNQYLANFKIKHHDMVTEYLQIRRMIDDYEGDEKLWKTYTRINTMAASSLEKIETRLSQFQYDPNARLQEILSNRHINPSDFEIEKMFFHFLHYQLSILVEQMANRYSHYLEEHSNPDRYETENSSEEDSDSGMDGNTHCMDMDEIVLVFLSRLILNKHQRFYLPLSMELRFNEDSDALDFAFITILEEHYLLKQKTINRFRSDFTVPEILVWGMKHKEGTVLDLGDYETTSLCDNKWSALAKIYQITGKKTLILHACIRPFYVADRFTHVDTLVFKDIHMTLDWNVNQFGMLLKSMQVKSLVLSHNYLYERDADWWKSLSAILTMGRIRQLNLSGNDLHKLSDGIWDTFHNDMRNTDLESININGSVISYPSASPKVQDPNRFFQPETDDNRTQPTASEQYVIS